MKNKKILIPVILLLLIVIVTSITCFSPGRRLSAYRKAMKLENIEYSFINMSEYISFRTVSKSGRPYIFPKITNITLPSDFTYNETTYNTMHYIDSSYTQGLIVLQNDTITYENYWRDQKENITHIAWSMSKSYVSALVGIAVHEGYIKSIQQTVEEYLPELKGSGYEGVKIKDVLQMSSGIKYDETYSDSNSDINQFWKNCMLGKPQLKLIKKLENHRPPGTFNEYASINTDVLGLIIARATGRSISTYLQEKISEPIGTEFDAYWLTDGNGTELAHGGLNVCLRDLAKFGRLYLHKGNWNGQQLIPVDWVESSTHSNEEYLQPRSKNSSDPGFGYGYQWWLVDGNENEIMAIGVYNQHIYINPTTNTVIVKNSANRNYHHPDNPYAQSSVHLALYRKIAYAGK